MQKSTTIREVGSYFRIAATAMTHPAGAIAAGGAFLVGMGTLLSYGAYSNDSPDIGPGWRMEVGGIGVLCLLSAPYFFAMAGQALLRDRPQAFKPVTRLINKALKNMRQLLPALGVVSAAALAIAIR